MPLIKGYSRKSVGDNIKTEEDSGKPKKQSLAIALGIARMAKRKAKKMADGGKVPKPEDVRPGETDPNLARGVSNFIKRGLEPKEPEEKKNPYGDNYAEGGEVESDDDADYTNTYENQDIEAAIQRVARAAADEDFSPMQPTDSNEHSRPVDITDRITAHIKAMLRRK